ncbi:MAG: nickel pincer cofactor biosynthesis protein LarC [Actinomycetota bacterium]
MTTLWIDASTGVSGDMLLGAFVDAGVPLDVLQQAVDPLALGIAFGEESVRRSALGATRVHVEVPESASPRHLPGILELLAQLPPAIGRRAAVVFERLADAEAAVHRVDRDVVHFHEVGGVDCIADVIAAVAAITHLGVDRLVVSTVGVGSGSVQTEHGRLPVPVPAVLELLQGRPTQAGPAPFEAATPTGAAVLTTLADDWGALPPMSIAATGVGAGHRDPAEFANVVRVVLGDGLDGVASTQPTVQLDANVDDLDPRIWPVAIDALLAAGAQDAWITPITMKKGRPAITISAMCDVGSAAVVRRTLVEQTSTIGVRESQVTKHVCDRSTAHVVVDGQSISIKVASIAGEIVNRSVEWDDVLAAAERLGRPAKEILRAATAAAGELDMDASGASD